MEKCHVEKLELQQVQNDFYPQTLKFQQNRLS